MKHGTCIHFNGTLNDACKRGVNYEVNWPKSPKPCIQFIEKSVRGGTVLKPGEEPAERKPFPGADTAKPCPFWEAPTDEQVQADREALDRSMQATLAAMKLAGTWRVKPKPAADSLHTLIMEYAKVVNGGTSAVVTTSREVLRPNFGGNRP